MHQALPGLCVFWGKKGTAGSQGVPSPFRRGKGEATDLPAVCMRANRGRAERSLLALFAGKRERGRLPYSPSVCDGLEKGTRLHFSSSSTRTQGKQKAFFTKGFLPFKILHILIQENKEKLSYTLEEGNNSIPTPPKPDGNQPRASSEPYGDEREKRHKSAAKPHERGTGS